MVVWPNGPRSDGVQQREVASMAGRVGRLEVAEVQVSVAAWIGIDGPPPHRDAGATRSALRSATARNRWRSLSR